MKPDDLMIIGEPPAKLVKALAVIADKLHPAFDSTVSNIVPGKSKESCVLASLAVRDFLWRIGFKDARLQTVYTIVRGLDAEGNQTHSVGVGDHKGMRTLDKRDTRDTPVAWSGHMVVLVDSFLIDPTVYQMRRPAWEGLPGMMVLPLDLVGAERQLGLDPLAGTEALWDDKRVVMIWLAQENERWRSVHDTRRDRRASVVKALVQAFGRWQEGGN
ncbi:hypothetical protein [Mesorhizobium sp.]|uniref:hypothetical protein n=1 Tax=Mesorhizobium sp. TaxID=1871066 RepID=UPI000FE377B0|nr:hypothetical protein [Mesorhizobium sp.]RWN98184.1 MAG: hypothetical protein EOS06_24550 [Mesorhizobium sp.]